MDISLLRQKPELRSIPRLERNKLYVTYQIFFTLKIIYSSKLTFTIVLWSRTATSDETKIKQTCYRPGVVQRVPRS